MILMFIASVVSCLTARVRVCMQCNVTSYQSVQLGVEKVVVSADAPSRYSSGSVPAA